MSKTMRVLVFGATSAICHEVLKRYAADGAHFYLVGRTPQKLSAVEDDLTARGGTVVGSEAYNFREQERHQDCIERAIGALEALDVVLIAHGSNWDQEESESSLEVLQHCLEENFISVALIAQACAAQLARQNFGTLAVVSSVAGDRGRRSNYSYGAAKAGIDAFLQGQRGRFAATPVSIVNVKPGMIKSPMTADRKHGLFWSTPEAIAPRIHQAISSGQAVLYVPGYWRLIMLVIRGLPNAILARLPI